MISVKGASFGRFGGWRRRYPGGSECRSIFLTVSRAMPNRLAASRWLRPSTWQASRTRRYRSTVYILPPSISKKIEGYRWQSFTPPAAGKSRRFRGLICHRRSQSRCPPGHSGRLRFRGACGPGRSRTQIRATRAVLRMAMTMLSRRSTDSIGSHLDSRSRGARSRDHSQGVGTRSGEIANVLSSNIARIIHDTKSW